MLAAAAWGSDPTAESILATKPAVTRPVVAPAGTGIMRLGDTFQPQARYRSYDYLIVGYSDIGAASEKRAKALVYKGGADVESSPNRNPGLSVSGVSYAEAAARGLLLKDASGQLLEAGADDWIGDVGSREFQKLWVANVLQLLLHEHGEGVFIDDVVCSLTDSAEAFQRRSTRPTPPGPMLRQPSWPTSDRRSAHTDCMSLRTCTAAAPMTAVATTPGSSASHRSWTAR